MGWEHRSRSPKKNDTLQWISKKLAVLGRYHDKRPKGLYVDGNGTLSLTNLMEAWGNSQGITEDDVLNAVRTNMTCGRTGRPRFALSGNSQTGEWHITVHQSGGDWGSSGGGSAPKEEWYQDKSNNGYGYGNGKSYGYDTQKTDYNSSNGGNIYTDQWKQSSQSDNWKSTASSTASPGWRFQRGAESEPPAAPTQKNDYWQQSTATSTGQSWTNKAKSWRLQSPQGQQGREEQISRLLSKILWDQETSSSDGWASLEDCVASMQLKRSDLGVESVEELKQILESSDTEGRFVIDDWDRVRKVARHERQAPATRTGPPSSRPTQAATWSSQKQRAPFNAFAKAEPEQEDAQPQAWTTWPKEEVDYGADDEEDAGQNPGKRRQPKLPPGKGWEMYDDNGVSWWYYEGPKGKWWLQEGESVPQPWEEGENGTEDS